MPKTVYMGGNPIQFADDVTDSEIVEFGDMQRQQSNNMRGIISPVANMIAQASMAAPVETSTLPQINGGNYAFAGRQVVQNALQQSQQSNQDRVSAQIQQRGMLQQQMEAEKDRSQQFKLEQMRFKNEAGIRQLEADRRTEEAKWSAEQDANKPINISGVGLYDPKSKQIVKGTEAPERAVRPMALGAGQSLVDPVTGQTIVSMPAAAKAPDDGPMGGPVEIFNPETNKVEVRQYYRNGTYGLLGEPPPKQDRATSPQDIRATDQIVADRVYQEGLALGVYTPDGNIVPGMERIASDLTAKHRAGVQAELGQSGASAAPASTPPAAKAIADHLRNIAGAVGTDEIEEEGTGAVYKLNPDGKSATRIR